MHGGLTNITLNGLMVEVEVVHPLVCVPTMCVSTFSLYEWPRPNVASARVTNVVVGVDDLIVISLCVLWSNVLTFKVLAFVNKLSMWVLLNIFYELRREKTVLPA